MSDNIFDDFTDTFKIHQSSDFEFKRIFGFTFVFKKQITTFNENITSAEIRPEGIIYEENNEYYFAPLYDVDNIEEIIREYVKNI